MKKIKRKITVGDKIVTNKNFKPIGLDGELLKIEEKIQGEIFGKVNQEEIGDENLFIVKFNKEYEFTHFLDNQIMDEPVYAYLSKKEFDIKEKVNIDEEIIPLYEATIALKDFNSSPIESLINHVRDIELNIKSEARTIKDLRDNLRSKNLDLKNAIVNKKFLNSDNETIIKRCKKITNHNKIKSFELTNDRSLIVTTEDLYFRCLDRDLPTFNLGGYKILIPAGITSRENIKIANYKRHYKMGSYHHPCINSELRVCLGDELSQTIDRLIVQKNIFQIIGMLIDFLQEPDYGSPYVDARIFYTHQPRTTRPRDQLNWFSSSYLRGNEDWDIELESRKSNFIQHKFSGQALSPADTKEKSKKHRTEVEVIKEAERIAELEREDLSK